MSSHEFGGRWTAHKLDILREYPSYPSTSRTLGRQVQAGLHRHFAGSAIELSNSSFTSYGRDPAAASVSTKKVAACCCTKRYSGVCSLLRAVTLVLVVDRGAILRPVGLPPDGLHALLSRLRVREG